LLVAAEEVDLRAPPIQNGDPEQVQEDIEILILETPILDEIVP
jgi:hypothetical protein